MENELTKIVQNADMERLAAFAKECPAVEAFFNVVQPLPYYNNFSMPKEQAFIELFRGTFKNEDYTFEERIKTILQLDKFIFINGFNENKALKEMEQSGKIRKVMQMGDGLFRVLEAGSEYIGVVKAGVGTAAISNIDKVMQINTARSGIYVGTCVSLNTSIRNGITIVEENRGIIDLRENSLDALAQPDVILNQAIKQQAIANSIDLVSVASKTVMRGYMNESPKLIERLKQEKVDVVDMESSFIIDLLMQRGIRTAVLQIPQDVFSMSSEHARSFTDGKKNVNDNYVRALALAVYGLISG